jgi:hypothetical protein
MLISQVILSTAILIRHRSRCSGIPEDPEGQSYSSSGLSWKNLDAWVVVIPQEGRCSDVSLLGGGGSLGR